MTSEQNLSSRSDRTKGTPTTTEEAREIYELRSSGLSAKEVAIKLGIDRRRVTHVTRKYQKDFPFPLKPRRVSLSKEQYEEAFKLHRENGISWEVIAQMFGVGYRHLAKAFKKRFGEFENGRVNYFNRAAATLKGNAMEWKLQRILELQSTGKTVAKIAEIMGLSYNQVRNFIRRHNSRKEMIYIPNSYEMEIRSRPTWS